MSEKRIKAYLAKSSLTGIIKTAIVLVSTVAFLPLIIRNVGIEKYGLISMVMMFSGVVVIVDFGMTKAVTLLIGQDKTLENSGVIATNALIINLIFVLLIAATLGALILFNFSIFGDALKSSDELEKYIILAAFLMLSITLLNNLLTAILEACYLMHYVNASFALASVLNSVFMYLTSAFSDSVYVFIASPIASSAIVLLYLVNVVRLHTRTRLVRPDLEKIRKMLRVSLKFFRIGLIQSFVLPVNKYVLVIATGSSSAIGVFDVALKIALLASSFMNSITNPLFGVFANMADNRQTVLRLARKVSGIVFILYILVCGAYYLGGHHISHVIDATNQEALFLVSWSLLLGLGFTSVAESFYRALLGTEQLKTAFRLKLVIPATNVIIYFCLDELGVLERVSISYASALFLGSTLLIILANRRKMMGL